MSYMMEKNPLESDGMSSEDIIGKQEEYGDIASTIKEIIYRQKDELTITKSNKVNKKIQRHRDGHTVHSELDTQDCNEMEEGGKIMGSENGVLSTDDNENDNVKKIDRPCVKESKNMRDSELGDDAILLFVGDELAKKNKTTLRIYYNNCNSLAINDLINTKRRQKEEKKKRRFLGESKEDSKFEQMMEQLMKWEINIGCLSETCTDWSIPITKTVIKTVSSKFDQNGTWTTSTSNMKTGSLYKPGGTGTFINGEISGKIVERGEDATNMGRWNYVTIQGKNDRRVNIITGYRCGPHRIKNMGSTTAFFQQYTIMRENGDYNPSPAKQFLDDLSILVSTKIEKDEEIILCMDANEEWKHNTQIVQFARQHVLHNVATSMFDDLPASKPSSNKTIDFMLVSYTVLESIVAYGMVPYNLEVLGDHRGMYMDVNMKKLLGSNRADNESSKVRKLKSNDKILTTEYLKQLNVTVTHHKIEERLKELILQCEKDGLMSNENETKYNVLQKEMYGQY